MTITINGTTGITNDGGYTGDGVVFADTTPANTLVTTTGGNVGIGTSSPTVYGSYKTLEVRGTGGGLLQIGTGASTAAYLFQDGTNAGFNNIANGIITFGTNNTERARIDSSGNLLVGTTSNFGSGAAIQAFRGAGTDVMALQTNTTGVQGIVRFYNPNGAVGNINTSGSSTAYATSSDYRLKENVQPMTGALAKVTALKPVTYKWKVDGSDGEGFIAHELQAVVPDCVTGEKDAVDAEGKPVYQGIDTSFLVATLTAAIQEQQAIILAQESALNALTARVAALEGTQP